MTRRLGWFLAGGLLVALLLAGVVSSFASGSPDGLDATARQGCTFNADDEITGGTCMLQQEREHQLADSPLADYGIRGVGNDGLSTGLSGALGVLITFGLGAGLFWLVRRRTTDTAEAGPHAGASPHAGPGPHFGASSHAGPGPDTGASSHAGLDPDTGASSHAGTGSPAGATATGGAAAGDRAGTGSTPGGTAARPGAATGGSTDAGV